MFFHWWCCFVFLDHGFALVRLEDQDSKIILLTHKEDFYLPVYIFNYRGQFIMANAELKKVVEARGLRYHVFSNSSKKTKQIMVQLKKNTRL